MNSLAVILPAGGTASRFGSNKLLATIGGKTVLQRSIEAFVDRQDVARVVVASTHTPVEFKHDKLTVVPGGTSRAESVWNAVKSLPESIEWIAVHDAARPLVSQDLISRVFAAAFAHGAAGPALPVALTIKESATTLPAPVVRTVPRQRLWAMQTPQAMKRADFLRAIEPCPIPLDTVTDDLQLLELIGLPAHLVPGEERNLKLTTALDLKLAELLL
jgi:2-C-methyl-D-erythritol 4-phosphate cytidylyltransferase